MKKKKSNLTTILIVLIFFVGLSLLLYPTVSDYWNSFTQSQAIGKYAEAVADIDEEKYTEIWDEAYAYNAELCERGNMYIMSDADKIRYNQLLNVSGNGVMGYIEIPTINVSLPIYHGTNDTVLQVAVGHLEGTSLPVGGTGSHCVVSGHRGLPRAKLFTDLDKLMVGDVFIFRVLNEILTYEVDQILIVDPHEVSALVIDPEQDYCTLVTCTPYGVNSHRMLVRGHRVENKEEAKVVRVTANAIQIEPLLVAPVVAAPILLVLLIALLFPRRQRHRGRSKKHENS